MTEALPEPFKIGDVIFILDDGEMASADLVQIRIWTDDDALRHPDMPVEVGETAYIIAVHAIVDPEDPEMEWMALPREHVYTYAEGEDARRATRGPVHPDRAFSALDGNELIQKS